MPRINLGNKCCLEGSDYRQSLDRTLCGSRSKPEGCAEDESELIQLLQLLIQK